MNKLFFSFLLSSLIGGPIVLSSCTGSKMSNRLRLTNQDSYCVPNTPYRDNSVWLSVPTVDSLRQSDSLIGKLLSRHDALLANAIGIFPLLQKLSTISRFSTLDDRLRALELKLQIRDQVLLAVVEIAALSAELDCEGERADQLADYLDNLNDSRNRRLTVFSIVLGSITTVATVLITNQKTQNVVGISGGILSAGLGGLTAFPSGKKIRLEHPRNVLADIWYPSERSLLYPPFVWYVLQEKSFSNSGQEAIMRNIKNRWITFQFDGEMDEKTESLLFKKGGLYRADQLHTRANMINQLQSTIRSINQDLQSLLLTLKNGL